MAKIEPKEKGLAVRLPADLARKLREYASETRRSVNSAVAFLCQEALTAWMEDRSK